MCSPFFFCSLKNWARGKSHPPPAGESETLSRKAGFGLRLRAGRLPRAVCFPTYGFVMNELRIRTAFESADAQDVWATASTLLA
jgi:hypothetical protein